MAGASMSETLLDPLGQLQCLSQTLFQSMSPTHTKPPSVPMIQSFFQVDTDLAVAIKLAHVHQKKQREIEVLMGDVLRINERWRTICSELEAGRKELQEIIMEGEERTKAIESAKQGACYVLSLDLVV
jgi:mediator of RNA polymerase II transcription subunit 4